MYWILRFIFYKFVVKGYGWYRRTLNRLGWKGIDSGLFPFLLNHKLVHVLVAIITVMLIIINLSPKTMAGGLTDKAHKTILADLVVTEFSGTEEDEQFIVETADEDSSLSMVQQSYLDNSDSLKPQLKVNMDEVDESLDTLATTQGGTSLVKPDLATTKITKRERTETVVYTVKPGDTISTIAQEFEVSVSTILWENELSAYSIIRPGDKLSILPASGLSYKVAKGDTVSSLAKKYDVEETNILSANKLSAGDILSVGDKIFIPGGKKIIAPTYTVKSYTGFDALKDIVAAPSAKPVAGNKMNWPTVNGKITQYFSWRHTAVDIANKVGTPIYAADAGTVEYSAWGGDYGNEIIVDHGGGKKTRYAHLSQFFVKKGDQVDKGQTIGAMGSTGNSTGPHLHFEVIINGTKYNPLDYIR